MCENGKKGCVIVHDKSSHNDTDRLRWLLHHVSGKELREIGVQLIWTGDIEEARLVIDKLIET
jgi:oligoribonuclease NrnB/cAMP/cGMP phosphodiesterase (DHH superfamily)